MRNLYLAPILLLMAILYGCTQQPYVASQIPSPIDPCSQMYFQEYACSAALNAGGYYHYGTWYPYAQNYPRTIVVYRDRYNGWVNQGNRPTVIDFNAPEYTRSYRSPSRQSNTSQGSYRADPSVLPSSSPATGSYRSEPAQATSSGSYREPQPRDPITGRFMKKESAPPSTSYRSQPPAATAPTSGSYRSTPASSPTRESGSYRSEPAKSTSYGSIRSATSTSTNSGSSRSAPTSSSSRSSSSSSTSSGSSRSSSSRR